MAEWFSIEVFDGASSARAWKEAYGDAVVAAAHTEGVSDWEWHEFSWGVVLGVELPDDFAWTFSWRPRRYAPRSTRFPIRSAACRCIAGGAAAPASRARGGHARWRAPEPWPSPSPFTWMPALAPYVLTAS